MNTITNSFLDQIEAALPAERYTMIRKWMDETPLPFFAELRERQPILVTEQCTLFALFDDVVDVLGHPEVFGVDLYKTKLGPEYMLSQDDTALHIREKGIMQAMLNRDDLPRVRQIVKQRANAFLDAAEGKIDLANDYGRSVPVALVQDYFGFEGIEAALLKEWSFWIQYDSFHNHPFRQPADPEGITRRATESRNAMAVYLQGLVPKVLAAIQVGNAPETIVGRILATRFPAAIGFPIEKAVRNMAGLLVGAVETTSQAAVQIVQELLGRPEIAAEAIAAARADTPEFDGYVWEALRFAPIGPFLFRKSREPYTMAKGTSRARLIPAGTVVLPLTLSAMFDPARFDEPEKFDAGRPWRDTFHLGFGIHECLGKYLAMVMIPEMVKQVLLRPGIKADGPIEFRGRPFPDFYPVSWDPAG